MLKRGLDMFRCLILVTVLVSLTACSQTQLHQFGNSADQGGSNFGSSMSQSISTGLQQIGQHSLT